MPTKKQKECKRKKIGATMHEFKAGRLKSGTGAIIKNRRQAMAIAIPNAEKLCKMKVSKAPKKTMVKKENVVVKKERK